jgi:hypothetical protein
MARDAHLQLAPADRPTASGDRSCAVLPSRGPTLQISETSGGRQPLWGAPVMTHVRRDRVDGIRTGAGGIPEAPPDRVETPELGRRPEDAGPAREAEGLPRRRHREAGIEVRSRHGRLLTNALIVAHSVPSAGPWGRIV